LATDADAGSVSRPGAAGAGLCAAAATGGATAGGGFTATLTCCSTAAGTASAAAATGAEWVKTLDGTTVAAVWLAKRCSATCGGGPEAGWFTITLVMLVILVMLTFVMLTLRM
jgi:energy-converting hydrogenase Eha subunit B